MRQKTLLFLLAVSLLSLGACQLPNTTGGNTPSGPIVSAHITPTDATFKGCPPKGDGGDGILNTFKNRTDEGHYTSVSLADLLALSWPASVQRKQRQNWAAGDQAEVAQYEGAPVETTGYILDYKHEGPESTNCHSASYRDYHIWLGLSASDPKSQSMVIEITPRVRDVRPGWTSEAISDLKGQHVRIRGWLLLDQEHPEQLGKTRKTLWEIHPIMHIEVDKGGGTWVSIDN